MLLFFIKHKGLFFLIDSITSFVNKFFSKTNIDMNYSKTRECFNIVMGTLLFISAKYEEIYPPHIDVFCKVLLI